MTYSFDSIIDRSGSGDLKQGALLPRWGRDDLLPLWVADMDFETPQFITEALRKRLQHSLFGYTMTPAELWPTVIEWVRQHHDWQLQPEWLTFIPGIVKGIGMAINVFTKPGDTVIIQPPVYHPFRLTPQGNERKVVYNPLVQREDGLYDMDLEGLEDMLRRLPSTDEGASALHPRAVLILCNPHNPGGVCWGREVLVRLAHLCHEYGVLVISDEIHADMALFGHRHIPFASVSDEARSISITFQAPSKTFNIAGIVSSYAIVPDDSLRRRFYSWLTANELNDPDIFAPIATIEALQHGEEWRRQMLGYVEQNILYVEQFVDAHINAVAAHSANAAGCRLVRVIRPEASFLVWLDCRQLKAYLDRLPHYPMAPDPHTPYSPQGNRLLDFFIDKAHLALNDGEMFGVGTTPNCATGYMRLNVAVPRSVLQDALTRLLHAVQSVFLTRCLGRDFAENVRNAVFALPN